MTNGISELELDAYVDGELCLERRMAVEDRLSRDPDAAARTMADLRMRTALRLMQRTAGNPPAGIVGATQRLQRRLTGPQRRWAPPVVRWTTVSAMVAVVALFATPQLQVAASPPAYVADALMSYQTGVLRAAMRSQIESPEYDRDEILRETRILVPRLPEGWKVTDVQIFPSDVGPALQMMARTAAGQDVAIFAVHARSGAPIDPVAIRRGGKSVAYWRNGDVSYALTGADDPASLDLAATILARRTVG